MRETDVLGLLLARADNYDIKNITPFYGSLVNVTMQEQDYRAVILLASFDYYEKRYHLARELPSLVVCLDHNTVLPIPVLSLRSGNLAKAYELPEGIDLSDLAATRRSKLAHSCLLGMYMCGMRAAQSIVKDLPETTRRRYVSEARALAKRGRGRPVGTPAIKAS